MDVRFAIQSEDRYTYKLPKALCVNMFVEEAPTKPDWSMALLSCPGIEAYSTLGGSACQGIDRQRGVLLGDIFAVASDTLYRVNSAGSASSIGAVGTGAAFARFAFIRPTATATQGYVVILNGDTGTPYLYDNSTLSTISDPDVGSSVRDIASINGRVLFATGDDQFVWSEVLDPSNVDSLSFATAERSPDDLKAILISQQEVWLMGGDTIEVYVDSGGFDVFVPVTGGFIERGLLSRDLACVEDNTVWWVGEDRVIYRANGYLPTRVSTHTIEEHLQGLSDSDAGDSVMWSYSQDGHKSVVLRTPTKTYAFDVATGVWHERKTREQNTYRAIGAVERGGLVIIADQFAGALRNFDTTVYTDMGQEIVAELTAFTPSRRNTPVFSFALDCARGVGTSTGQGSDPQAMLRWSDDDGNTWSNEYWRDIGQIGKYGEKITWRQLGQITPQGRVWELKISDPVPRMVFGARVNDLAS